MEQIYEDGRSLRAKNIYDDKHKKLVNTAIELLNNPLIPNEKINLSLIAKHAGTSVATAYNHFPDNLMDVYGSIFSIAFQDIVKKVEEYNQTEPNPLKRINYYIENIYTKPRLLKENLIFEIWTNGSITPECAIKNASEILINLFSVFIEPPPENKQNLIPEKKTNILIEELNLSVRAYNCLKAAQINSLEDLMQYSLKDLGKIKSFGQKSMFEVINNLKNNYGIILKN